MMGDARSTFVHRVKGKQPIQRFYSPRRRIVLRHDLVCDMFFWGNLPIKDTLARLRRNRDAANGPLWEIPENVSADYLAQLTSEHRIQKNGQWRWVQIGDRDNHYLDTESLAVAAGFMLKLIGQESISPEAGDGKESNAVPDTGEYNTETAGYSSASGASIC